MMARISIALMSGENLHLFQSETIKIVTLCKNFHYHKRKIAYELRISESKRSRL